MKIKNSNFGCHIVIIVAISILLSGTYVLAQDWPQWRGINRDGKLSGFEAPESWPKEMKQNWRVNVGTGDATTALVNDKVYVFTRQGENEVILCLNADNGDELWRDQYAAQPVTGAASRHPGPRSSPVVMDGKVVTLGASGILSCLDATTGEVLWRKEPFPGVVPRFFTAMSPMIVDGMCIAHLGKAGDGAIIAYDLQTGEEKWRWIGEGPEYASPVLLTIGDSKQIVSLAEKSVVGVDIFNGKLLWQIPFEPQGRAYNAATPIIDGQNVIIIGASRGAKSIRIEKQEDIFITKELWSNSEVDVQFNTPVLKDGSLYGVTSKDNLFCINAQTGQTNWIDQAKNGSGGFASILDAGSVMMLLTNNSELIIFEPNDKEYKELSRYKVSDTQVYAHPVVSGNRVYVKDSETLAMWTIK